nr:DapH/DapD/GlmU-related protein [Roseibium aggregatum]
MDIHPTALFSLSARLDKTHPKGIHIGEGSYIAFDAAILTHDMTRALRLDTVIGKNCFIGARSIVLPGVTIGDGCVVGSGSVVTKDIPSGCAVAGNPAQIIRQGIETLSFGRLKDRMPPKAQQ